MNKKRINTTNTTANISIEEVECEKNNKYNQLKEKQDKEFEDLFITSIKFGGFPTERLLNFIDKVRKETAECVCGEIIGKEKNLIDTSFEKGYNYRIKEEKEIKKQIIENL